MANFLEQLVAEWHEFNGYFVRRNVRVGPRAKGGHEGELDVVAFHPERKHLVHVEASTDADTWAEREAKFTRKFDIGRRYVPGLFQGIDLPTEIEQIALFVSGSTATRSTIGGGRILMVGTFLNDIKSVVASRSVFKAAVPEHYPLLRTLQFAAQYWH